jgi:hypothetical protein
VILTQMVALLLQLKRQQSTNSSIGPGAIIGEIMYPSPPMKSKCAWRFERFRPPPQGPLSSE